MSLDGDSWSTPKMFWYLILSETIWRGAKVLMDVSQGPTFKDLLAWRWWLMDILDRTKCLTRPPFSSCAFGKIILLSRVNNSINSEKKWQCSHSAVSDSLWSFWLSVAARLLHPWDFPGKNTRVVITIQWASSIRLIPTWMQPGRKAEAHGSRMICPRPLSVCCPQKRNKVYSLSVFNLKNVPLNYPNTSELISFHYLFTNLLLCTE